MNNIDVFVSVGGTANNKQEVFVRAVEDRLRSEGFTPHTVGRNAFSADSPLKSVTKIMENCAGTVVIALERTFFPNGAEKRGGENESLLTDVKLPTSWNQIEATMSYVHNLPLMVIVENGLRSEGLLEHGYDWYVQRVELEPEALNTNEFNGILASWKNKIQLSSRHKPTTTSKSVENMSVAELLGSLKPRQVWSVLGAIATVIVSAFVLGANLNGAS